MKSHPNRRQPGCWSLRVLIACAAIVSSGITTARAGCPGTINFDNSAGTGLWATAANWDTNTLPGPADDVCINGFSVSLSFGSQAVHSLTVDGAGALAISSSLDLASASQIDGSLTLSGGTLSGSGDLTVNGTTSLSGHALMTGTGRTKVTGGLTLTSFGGHLNGGRVLEVPSGATVTMSGTGNLFLDGPASVENSGTWNITGDQFISGATSPDRVFTNLASGVLRKTGGTGVSPVGGMFDNAGGTVEVQSGELWPGPGTHTGPFLVSAGTLNLNSATTFNAGSSVSGPGQVTVSAVTSFNAESSYAPGGMTLVTGTLNLNTGATPTLPGLTLPAGTLAGADNIDVTGMANVSGHALMTGTGRTKVTGGLTLTSFGGHLNGGRVLEVPSGATVTMSGTGNLFLDGPASVENSGTWNITGDQFISGANNPANTFTNLASGVLRKSGGTGTSQVLNMTFSNSGGTVEALSGTLQVHAYTQTAGATRLDGGALSSDTAMSFQGGSLTGAGTISAPGVANSGEMSPGAPLSSGLLGLSGTYSQSAQGRLRSELGGLAPGSGYDQVNVTGAVTLSGELVLQRVNGYAPNLGDIFTLMTFGSRGGTMFSTFIPEPAPCGLDWNLVYTGTSVFAEVVPGACPDVDGDGIANCCHPACILVDGDVCGDCNDADAGAIALPQEATGLLLGSDKVTLSWTSVIPQAGSATVHDVVTGLISELPVGNGGSETCLATVPAATATDSNVPDPGAAKWYLVRGRNSCGAGIYGQRSNGAINDSPACP